MQRAISFIRKILAGLNCIILQIVFYKRLKISIPSITFSINPFLLFPGSMTILGKMAIVAKHCEIISLGRIKIGNNFCINKYSRIVAHKEIIIGNNVTIAQFVSILDHDHAYKIIDNQMILDGYKIKKISIGNNVWIADKVTICKGVTIGNNVIIGANSVVIKDIEDNCIAVGNPCKKIKNL